MSGSLHLKKQQKLNSQFNSFQIQTHLVNLRVSTCVSSIKHPKHISNNFILDFILLKITFNVQIPDKQSFIMPLHNCVGFHNCMEEYCDILDSQKENGVLQDTHSRYFRVR